MGGHLTNLDKMVNRIVGNIDGLEEHFVPLKIDADDPAQERYKIDDE